MQALAKLATDSYDVSLLDIDLRLSGFQFVNQLRQRDLPLPSVVFATAHIEYAVAAFERYTADYVLKPFSHESINEALDRAARRAKGERAAKLTEALPQLQKLSCPGRPMIAIKDKGRILFSILAMWSQFKLKVLCVAAGEIGLLSSARVRVLEMYDGLYIFRSSTKWKRA